jgi:phage head maturation protease
MASDNPAREVLARSVVAAAERGDRFAFAVAAQRYGSIESAQELVRNKAVLRMADRVVSYASKPRMLPTTTIRTAQSNGAVASDTLYGHFTVWDAWYEVDSFFEGHFMERTVRGSAKKTIRENRDAMRALFQHGSDPIVADKPLGPIADLREDDEGAYYEVPLLRDDNGDLVDYVRGIAPGIRDGLYGASFRFRALREFWDDEPEASDYNPNGLPERSLKEMQVMEFGPVTFPASRAATAALRAQPRDGQVRMDVEDLSCLAQMIGLGADYIAEQDEPGDEVNIPKMEAIIASLTALVPYEVQENEVEDEDDPAGRSKKPGRTPSETTPPSKGTSDAGRREADKRFRTREEWLEWATS